MTAVKPETLDFADPRTFLDADIHELWQVMHSEAPVHWNAPSAERVGFWVVSRYKDIVATYRDNVNFTSVSGNVLTTLLQGHDSAGGRMIAVSDGRYHRSLRNLILKSFGPSAMEPVIEKIEARTTRLIQDATEKGEIDFAADIASHVPINTIGDLMDVPECDREQLAEWNTLSLAREGLDGDDLDEIIARNELLMYLSDLADHRRRIPGDDVVSALANGTVAGRALTDEEVVLNCYSLILGADQTTRMSSIGGAIALAEHPEQWQALRDGTVSLPSATEEILRWTTPAMHFGRTALNETTVGGQRVRMGEVVTLWNVAGNLDEAVFPQASQLHLDRTPNRHISFGYGPHFCIGAFLGRAHLKSVLAALRSNVAAIELLGPAQRLHSNFVQGYTKVPMRLSAQG